MSGDEERAWNELAEMVGLREEDRAPSVPASRELVREALERKVAVGRAAELELARARRSRPDQTRHFQMTNSGRFEL